MTPEDAAKIPGAIAVLQAFGYYYREPVMNVIPGHEEPVEVPAAFSVMNLPAQQEKLPAEQWIIICTRKFPQRCNPMFVDAALLLSEAYPPEALRMMFPRPPSVDEKFETAAAAKKSRTTNTDFDDEDVESLMQGGNKPRKKRSKKSAPVFVPEPGSPLEKLLRKHGRKDEDE